MEEGEKEYLLESTLEDNVNARECIIIIVIRYCETNQKVAIKWILFVHVQQLSYLSKSPRTKHMSCIVT